MKTSPLLWIEELRILRSWSLDPAAEVRRIAFRRGLNIIWAQASHTDQQELPGFGGHAAGKTSLCRLIRFVLGEQHYGSRFMRDRILNAFENGWVVAKVWVKDTAWVVARPFRSGLHPKSCVSESIETLFENAEAPGRYDDFREAIHKGVMSFFPLQEFPSEKEPISFAHLLAWLARDQESRLSGLLDWRHPSSNHDSPGMSAEQRRFLIRATLDLVDDIVRQEIEKRHKLEVELTKIPDDSSYQKRSLQEHLTALRLALAASDLPDVGESLFVDTVKRLAIAQRDAAFAPIDKQIQALNLPQLRTRLNELNQDLGAKRYQETEIKEQLKILNTRFQEAQRDGKQASYDKFWESLKPTDQFCSIPIAIARFRCPLRQEFEPEAPPAPIQQDLQAQAQEALLQIQNVEKNLQPLTAACSKLDAEVKRQSQAIAAAESRQEQLQKDRNAVEQAHTLTVFRAEQAVQACKTIETLEQRQKNLEHDIEESKKRQDALQKRQAKQIADFSTLYESTLKAFLGSSIEASCRFTREEIDLKAEYHGELSSAAIDTLKTIAFDIAALRSGILGTSHHPGFILFDSPREADMHPTPYQCIFHHLKSLECPGSNAQFQVIITTTEPPPSIFHHSEELILKLDASKKEGRVYRTDFV
jgi:hypothetical protein